MSTLTDIIIAHVGRLVFLIGAVWGLNVLWANRRGR